MKFITIKDSNAQLVSKVLKQGKLTLTFYQEI